MTDLACVYCGKPAYIVFKGNSMCYDHWKKPWPYQPDSKYGLPEKVRKIAKEYLDE